MTAGGAAGGSMAGGAAGGTAMAGGAGGGTTAGGMGGGAASTCAPACEEWQVCETRLQPPSCVDAVLTVGAPSNGLVTEVQASVPAMATLSYDGGLVRTSIPVNAVSLAPTAVASGGAALTVVAPSVSQLWTLRFGWDGGPREDRQVEVRGCERVTCGEWQSCTGTVDGGACADGVVSVSWSGVSPDGGPYRPGASVTVVAVTQMRDGGVYTGTVPVTGAVSATLNGATNVKSGAITTPNMHGPFSLTAGWDGGPSATVGSAVDSQGPGLTVIVENAPARLTQEVDLILDGGPTVYRKDEVARVRVVATEDSEFSGMNVAPAATVVAGSQCTGCGNAARCQCFTVNLEPLSFSAMRGTMGLSVSGVRDLYGNVSQNADAGIQVTRWKWGATLPDGLSARAAPALDSKGRLYVGTIDANNNSSGNVYRIGVDGQVVLFTSGAAVQSVAVADSVVGTAGARQEVVYVASNTSAGGNLQARFIDGGLVPGSGCAFYGLQKTYSAVALFDAGMVVGGMEVGAAAVFEPGGGTGTGGALCVHRPFNGPAQLTEAVTADWVAPTVPNPANSATNMVAVDNSVYLLQSNRELRRFTWNGVWTDQGTGPAIAASGVPVSLAAAPNRLFATVSGPAAPFISMSRSGAEQSNLSFAGAGAMVLGPATEVTTPAPALVFTSTMASTGAFLQKILTSLTSNVVPLDRGGINFTPTGAVEAAPVLGSPRGGQTATGDVLLYAMRRGGVLQVVSVDGAGAATAEWTGNLFSGGNPSFFAAPTLDCGRDASGVGRIGSGTFYAVTSDGRIGAVIVDSPKLATDAPWPKWQRTAGNAGNPAFPLNPGCP